MISIIITGVKMNDKECYFEFYCPDKGDTRKEVVHQIEAYQHVLYRYPKWVAFHPVNENKKTNYTANIDQQSGLLRGVSDLIILTGYHDCIYPFAAIEMKRVNKSGEGKASPVSAEQREFLANVRRLGGFAAVAYGSEQFKAAIKFMLEQH